MPRGSKATKESKRRAVARGLVAGQSVREITRAAGCHRRYVQRLAHEPETQFLVTEALRPHRARLEKLAKQAISAVSVALKAKKTDKTDHFSRLRAVERYGDLLELAQGKPQESHGDNGPLVTWEEFVVLYRARQETRHATTTDKASAPPVG